MWVGSKLCIYGAVQSWVEMWPSEHATSIEHERSEGSMFNFSNAFLIGSSLLSFLPFVALTECGCSVGWFKRVKNPDVKVGTLTISSPEVCCCNIEAGTVFSVSRSVTQLLFGDWLKVWFSAYTVADFLHHFCCYVPEFIMSN